MIAIIVAAAKNRMIGKDNDFPWHLSADLKRFRQLTTGHPVIMGRKTYQHLIKRLGKPLPNRTNIVVTRNPHFKAEGVLVASSVEQAVQLGKAEHTDIFIIGGEQIYRAALPLTNRIYLTEIDAECAGDAFLPPLNPAQWRETARQPHQKDAKNDYNYSFVTLEKRHS